MAKFVNAVSWIGFETKTLRRETENKVVTLQQTTNPRQALRLAQDIRREAEIVPQNRVLRLAAEKAEEVETEAIRALAKE